MNHFPDHFKIVRPDTWSERQRGWQIRQPAAQSKLRELRQWARSACFVPLVQHLVSISDRMSQSCSRVHRNPCFHGWRTSKRTAIHQNRHFRGRDLQTDIDIHQNPCFHGWRTVQKQTVIHQNSLFYGQSRA